MTQGGVPHSALDAGGTWQGGCGMDTHARLPHLFSQPVPTVPVDLAVHAVRRTAKSDSRWQVGREPEHHAFNSAEHEAYTTSQK
eukprot:358984-Chlamydomonas_euryale.AAC.2